MQAQRQGAMSAATQSKRLVPPPTQTPVRAPRVARCRVRAAPSSRRAALMVRALVDVKDKPAAAQVPSAPAPASSAAPAASASPQPARPRVVVLGSGWASMSFIKALPSNCSEKYDFVLASPRNYFLYTPLLPAVATGTMEERSIVEPVRNLITGKGSYYEAAATDIDPVRKEMAFCAPAGGECFFLSYDVLIIGVGAVNTTFGIKGVEQNTLFFKNIEDAHKLRCKVSECFERASLPMVDEEERKRLLSFVVVGGGPTGTEVMAELYDMIHDNLATLYPQLMQDVQLRIVELTDHLLSTYDRVISKFTEQQFGRDGIQLVMNSRVVSVDNGVINLVDRDNRVQNIEFGACVWATGVGMNPLLKVLQARLPEQNHTRALLTDKFFRVRGSNGSIFALGDASTMHQPKALAHAEELFAEADVDGSGRLTLCQLRDIVKKASLEYPHLQEHARFLDCRAGGTRRCSNLVRNFLCNRASVAGTVLENVDENTALTQEQFKELLKQVDARLRALPPTAQVAKQEGEYLADMFMHNKITGSADDSINAKKFEYFHKGSTAYIGQDMAVFDIPVIGPLVGWYAGLLWKGYETYAQISLRNRVLVFNDWFKTKVFGRDISRV